MNMLNLLDEGIIRIYNNLIIIPGFKDATQPRVTYESIKSKERNIGFVAGVAVLSTCLTSPNSNDYDENEEYINLDFMKTVFKVFENEYGKNENLDDIILEFFLDLYEGNTLPQCLQILSLVKNKELQNIILNTDGNPYNIEL